MHICTVQHIHPCFDKIATILAKRHQRAQRSLQTKHPPYTTQKCRFNRFRSIERVREVFNSHIICPSNKSGSGSTQTDGNVDENVQDTCEFLALTRLLCLLLSGFKFIPQDSHQSQRTCKKAKPSHFIFGVLQF